MLRIKTGVALEILRKYGFAPGAELATLPAYQEVLGSSGYEYQHGWWHKYLMDADEPGKIAFIDPEFDIPKVHAWIDTRHGNNILHFDVAPVDTYHIGMDDLDLVTHTVFELTRDGLLEIVPS